jgi:RHS repeat-associated protein
MSEFRINTVLQGSYKYGAMGRQAIRTLTSPTPVTIHSVFDSDGRRIAEYNETSGALIREYVWNGWDPVAVIEGGVIAFVRADHIGRPVFATNSSGVKVWTATYMPFGGVHVSTGTLPPNRFPGQWFQSESGLHQNWMRDYDPTTGRYLQADPLGLVDGASVYGYVGQNPGRSADPTGEFAWTWPIIRYIIGAGVKRYFGPAVLGAGAAATAVIIPFPGPKPGAGGGAGGLPPNDPSGQCGPNDECGLIFQVTAEQAEAAGVYPQGTGLGICVYYCPASGEYVKVNMSGRLINAGMSCLPIISRYRTPAPSVSAWQYQRLFDASQKTNPLPFSPLKPVE